MSIHRITLRVKGSAEQVDIPSNLTLLGKITLWASSQSPFAQRSLIAKTLHVSPGDFQVVSPYVE